eukprot:TRINITY_DN17736_c0_g2_i1.p1 TRINITY_DN17736_c0_g2~~TRINITY_DN17736_c0_g2_i1.p1  ORF type:complete len:382 (-),score=33.85 TRINITY_DN17736_c0_g2_i1:130-1116(-)
MSDVLGRRRMCLVFCFLYMLHCALHVSGSFSFLLLARVISGVATALLFSAFEAWMVSEHRKRFPNRNISDIFAIQTQGNALSAVVAGLIAQLSVMLGGYAAPMALAIPMLAYSASEVYRWPENVGSKSSNFFGVARKAIDTLNSNVARVGVLQCLFEGSMHVFVFLWTPCLQRAFDSQEVPNGLIFSLYMVCMMIGGWQCGPSSFWTPSLGITFAVAAASLMMPSVSYWSWGNLSAFCVFEWCVGCYFPQIAVLRSRYLCEETRSCTITLFRVPFNLIVVAVLLWGRYLPPEAMLRFASFALGLGALVFYSMKSAPPGKKDDKIVNEK